VLVRENLLTNLLQQQVIILCAIHL